MDDRTPNNYGRRKEDTPLQRNLASVRTVLEALVVLGVAWLVGTGAQTREDMAVIKSKLEAVDKVSSEFPEFKARVNNNQERIGDHERRIRDLETIKRVR